MFTAAAPESCCSGVEITAPRCPQIAINSCTHLPWHLLLNNSISWLLSGSDCAGMHSLCALYLSAFHWPSGQVGFNSSILFIANSSIAHNREISGIECHTSESLSSMQFQFQVLNYNQLQNITYMGCLEDESVSSFIEPIGHCWRCGVYWLPRE